MIVSQLNRQSSRSEDALSGRAEDAASSGDESSIDHVSRKKKSPRKSPTLSLNISSESTQTGRVPVNTSSRINVHLSRPMGVKKAKALEKLKRRSPSSLSQSESTTKTSGLPPAVANSIAAAAHAIPQAVSELTHFLSNQQVAAVPQPPPQPTGDTTMQHDVALLRFLPQDKQEAFALKLYEIRMAEMEAHSLRLDMEKKEIEVKKILLERELEDQQSKTFGGDVADENEYYSEQSRTEREVVNEEEHYSQHCTRTEREVADEEEYYSQHRSRTEREVATYEEEYYSHQDNIDNCAKNVKENEREEETDNEYDV